MDAQTRVNQASFEAVKFLKQSLENDIVQARRQGMILAGVSDGDLERLIQLVKQSVDAAWSKQQPVFSRTLGACMEQARSEGAASRKK